MYDTYMSAPILVTGAGGNIGRPVVAGLLAVGADVRAAVPPGQPMPPVPHTAAGDTGASSSSGTAADFETVDFDFTDSTTWAAAFTGVDTMFLLRPPQLSKVERDLVPALTSARAAGVRHVVFLSLQGADHNRFVPHAKVEQWLVSSGMDWTFVRPSFFMENLSTTHASDIRDRDEICVPAGSGATAFVAADDVAAVAVAALLDPAAHRNRAWTPTGPAALTYDQVAADLSAALGRPIRYTHPGALRYAWHAASTLDMPLPMVAVTTAIYSVARFGRADGLTEDVRTVTGRPPQDFTTWAAAHTEAWR